MTVLEHVCHLGSCHFRDPPEPSLLGRGVRTPKLLLLNAAFQRDIEAFVPTLLFRPEVVVFSNTARCFVLCVFLNGSALHVEIKISILVYERWCGLEIPFPKK